MCCVDTQSGTHRGVERSDDDPGKRYSASEYGAASMLVLGIVLFTMVGQATWGGGRGAGAVPAQIV